MSKRTLLVLRIAVFIAACAFLYVRLGRDGAGLQRLFAWFTYAHSPWSALVPVVLLMLLNWSIEALKWRVLVREVERMPFVRAFAAVVAGTSIGLITPNRVGEFAGRVLFLRPDHRVRGAFATLLGSIAQFVVTVLVGALFLFLFPLDFVDQEPGALWPVVRWCALLIGGATVFLYFSPGTLEWVFLAVPWSRRFERQVRVLGAFRGQRLTVVATLSGLRYAVFTLQFAWLLHTVGAVPWSTACARVPVIFLVTTLIPTTALTELGVRGSVTDTLVSGGDPVGVVVSSILIWAVNIALPALVGSLILLVARIRTESPDAG